MFLKHRFVDFIPNELEPGILYIALEFGTVVHLCACGCGNETVTPLSRTDWSMTYNGETISLSPSVGNWSFPCQSHYFITKGEVRPAPKWSDEEIDEGRRLDQSLKNGVKIRANVRKPTQVAIDEQPDEGWLRRSLRWLTG